MRSLRPDASAKNSQVHIRLSNEEKSLLRRATLELAPDCTERGLSFLTLTEETSANTTADQAHQRKRSTCVLASFCR